MSLLSCLWFILIVIVVQSTVDAFITCPSGGVQQCATGLAPYQIINVDNLIISNCVFLGCPQIVISASNVTIQNCTFNANAATTRVLYDMGGALNIISDIFRVRPTKVSINATAFRNYRYTVSNGGAIYIGSALSETVIISNSIFDGNRVNSDGAALHVLNCPLIMRNCILNGNNAGGNGGALLTKTSTTTLDGCTFTNNVATYGGAIYKESSDSLIINNCYARWNTVSAHGAFTFLSYSLGIFVFSNSILADGSSSGGVGAGFFMSGNSFRFENSSISNLRTPREGAGIQLWGCKTAFIKNVSFSNIVSTGGSDGGGAALFYLNGNVTVEDCKFDSSGAENGGAISFINLLSPTALTIRNSIFTRNYASNKGGAVSSDGNNLNVYNCLFDGNTASLGGAIHANGPYIYTNVEGSTFANSQATSKAGTISIDGLVSLTIKNTSISNSVAGDSAGSIYLLGPLQSPAIFTDFLITGSSATNLGGALYFDADSSFICTNCQVSNVASGLGAFIYAEGPTKAYSIISNSRISDCVSVSTGGFISLRTRYQLSISNSSFARGTSAQGGAFNIALGSALKMVNSTIVNVTAIDTGGLLYSTGNSDFAISDSRITGVRSFNDATIAYCSTGSLNITRTVLGNLQLFGTGSFFSLQLSTLALDVLTVANGPSLLDLKLQSQVNIGRLTSSNCMGTNIDGSLISCYQGSNLVLGSGSTITGFQGLSIFSLFSKSKVQLSGASFLGNSPLSYGFRVSEGSSIDFISSQLASASGATSFSPIYLDAGSMVNCVNSQVTGNFFGGCGTVYVGKGSFFNASNCAIMGNSFASQSFTCNANSKVLSGFGGGICCDGKAVLGNGAIIANNSASNGGAMYFGPLASVKINAGVSIINNRADNSGGAFYFRGSQLQIDAKGVIVAGNTALNSNSSSLAYFGGLSDGLLTLSSNLTTSNLPNSVLSGGILVEYPKTAYKALSMGLVNSLPNTVSWKGRASYLQVLNRDDFIAKAKALNLSQTLPSIIVATYDYFGNPASFDPSAIVTVQLSEVSQSSPLSGDVIKSILDANTGTLSFDNVQLPQRLPGSYLISVSAVQGTIKELPSNSNGSSLLPVTFTPCALGLRLVPSVHDCFPTINLSSSFRIGLSLVAVLALIYSFSCAAQLYRYRGHATMKKTLRNFNLLIVQVMGISISLFSLIFEAVPISAFCGISLWLENIGFTLILYSLCLATLELLQAMRDRRASSSSNKLEQQGGTESESNSSSGFSLGQLRIWGIVVFACLVIYLSIWSAIDPLQFRDIFFPSTKLVLVDKCKSQSNIFFIVLQGIKFSVAFLAANLSLRIERKKSNIGKTKFISMQVKEGGGNTMDLIQLEESELLSLCSYNWLVFGPVISLIAELSISDPDTGFFFAKISVLVPTFLTLLIMATSRIYLCSFIKRN